MTGFRIRLLASLLLAFSYASFGVCHGAGFDDGQINQTRALLKGKRVGFVPISLGFDLTQAWYEGLQRSAKSYGFQLIVREANWSVQTGAQAINSLIGERVDVLIVQPPEMLSYARLLERATAAGITVVQINLKAPVTGDAYVGADWGQIFIAQGEEMTKRCGTDTGHSGKIAFVEGALATTGNQIAIQTLREYFRGKTNIQIVADQAADWDTTKARAVTATILKQHEDLCGIVGFWEVQDMGVAAAIREAGKTGKVVLITNGGGEQKSNCANVANGNFTVDVSYDARGQARDLTAVVLGFLQNKPTPAGAHPIGIYSPIKLVTAANAATACWGLDDVKRDGP